MANLMFLASQDELKDLIREVFREELRALPGNAGPADPNEPLMNAKTAAAFIDRPESTIYQLVHRREIPHIKKGKRLYFTKPELIGWLKTGKVKTLTELQTDASLLIK